MKSDYLIVGSGLSALTFGALMANAGKTVQVLEAHEHPGGFGHTFTMAKKYKFNAQFHYVWDCGEGQTVNRVLKKLGCQIVEFLTVANYDYFKQLRDSDPKAYRQKKQEILDTILDVVEKHYVPNFRKHMVFDITGRPTTNERYCWCPEGNSYGSTLTPSNMGLGRLNHQTSLEQFYFCNASSGYPGFAPTIWTGALLYQRLSGDVILGSG
jgi:phytoene dehydrogenase-like protein